METIIKQSADGLILSRNNNFNTNLGKVFINKHEITDINTFFKVAEENTRLIEQIKKQKEVIDKTRRFLKDEGQKQYNIHDNYRGKWYSPDELDILNKILEDKEVSE